MHLATFRRARLVLALALLPCALSVLSQSAFAADAAADAGRPVPVRVELRERSLDLRWFDESGMDVDAVFDGWARVYASPKQIAELQRAGFAVTLLPDEGRIGLARLAEEGLARGVGPGEVRAAYHDYVTLTQDLQAIAAAYPDITRLSSIGPSVEGRELWFMKITDNPDVEEDEPELAYIAAMHGDEVVGKEMCFNLINLLTSSYGYDPRINQLVDSTEIWIMPSMNPDGTAAGTRYNAQGIDLNRNFPDWFMDPNNTPDGRAQETGLMMAWTEDHSTDLSANFHGGALVINYPFDNNPSGSSVFSPTPEPDHPAFVSISETYASNNLPMHNSPVFPGGITNGAAWYAISGGMQDWNYCWYGNWQVTAEIGNNKWPPASQLPQYWDDNRESMLSYFERVYEGVRGVVTDAQTGAPVAATVHIDDNPFPSYTDPDVGDYHRLVLPGSYVLEVAATGYGSQVFPITVVAGPAVRYDVQLQPLATDLQIVNVIVDDGPGGDGWLDPGETAVLEVTLRNQGRSARGVGARMLPASWRMDLVQADATFPDIPLGAEVVSNAPHYEVAVDPLTPEGRQVGFALEWHSVDASGVTEPFFLAIGGPWCATHDALDVPQPIQDYQTTTSRVTILAGQVISDVHIPMDVSHTYIGDLTIDVTSPAGTTVRLHDRSGGGSANIVGTYGEDLTPAEPLSAFTGETSHGRWRLDVTDHAGSDSGTLNGWGVEICDEPEPPPTPEILLRGVSVERNGVLVRWWPYPGLESYRVYRAEAPDSVAGFVNVTAEDDDDTDEQFLDLSTVPLAYYLVTGVGPQGEGPLGHYGQ